MIELFRIKLMLKSCQNFKVLTILRRFNSSLLEKSYGDEEKVKILKVINEFQESSLSRYEISKPILSNILQWIAKNGEIKTIGELELIKGLTERTAKKLFDSIINNKPKKETKQTLKNILYPLFKNRECCRSVLVVHVTSYSICWMLINRSNYEVQQWEYYDINLGEKKKALFTDIYDIVWKACTKMPDADVYVMQGESTVAQPKNLKVNLQKLQMICMIIAVLNSRESNSNVPIENKTKGSNKIYFLQPSLAFRLYDVFIGNERVSTENTVEDIFKKANARTSDNSHVFISKDVQVKYRNNNELQRDMLGQCLLLAITFMDLCVYLNEDSRKKITHHDLAT